MIESITLITLCVLYLVFFRPGKTPPLSNPLVIDRPGKYHMTLAPNLNLAQPFIEAIAQQLMASSERSCDSSTQYFEVKDKHVTSHGHDNYLLAITQRDGKLFFQAAAPSGDAGHLQAISEYSRSVLEKFPSSAKPDATVDQGIMSAVLQVASTKPIMVEQIK